MEPVARNEPVTERVGVVAPRTARTNRFPAIAWSSIIGGLVVGLATHMLMMLLGVAAGLTAVEFTTTGLGVQNVPEWSAAWNGLSMLLAAFVGGYVAARMSGLRRKADGVLHGFVAWGRPPCSMPFCRFRPWGPCLAGSSAPLPMWGLPRPAWRPKRKGRYCSSACRL